MRKRFLISGFVAGAFALALPAQGLADETNTACDSGAQPVVFVHTDNDLLFANIRVLCVQDEDEEPVIDLRPLH